MVAARSKMTRDKAAEPSLRMRLAKAEAGRSGKAIRTGTTTEQQSAQCRQCHTSSSVFYCSTCLSERIISHHVNLRRVGEMRLKGSREVQRLVGIGSGSCDTKEVRCEEKTLSDPFEDPAQRREKREWNVDRVRSQRANKAALLSSIANAKEHMEMLRSRNGSRSRMVEDKRELLSRRRAMLDRARKYTDPKVTGNRSVTMTQFPVSPAGIHLMHNEVATLQKDGKVIATKLADTRAILAREAFSLFSVSPPPGTLASARAAHGQSAWTGPPSRTQRSRERYIPGAFVFGTKYERAHERQTAIQTAQASQTQPVNLNDWTIMGLVLPLASDLKRFDRSSINGAIAHTVHLLHLLTMYLGIAVPFDIPSSTGSPTIRPNPLWGSGTKQSLYLSSTAHSALASNESSGGLGSMGASMISTLGASTMSTLESFVQLPNGANLPWAKNTTASPTGAITEDVRQAIGGQSHGAADVKSASSSKHFCTALTMLAYDVAYLAHLSGVHIDILNAAGSPLRLLSKAINNSGLGFHAHATCFTDHHVDDLVFKSLDFSQFAQVHEPGGMQSAPAPAKAQGSSKSRGGQASSSKHKAAMPAGNTAMLDGSYIDARKVAESILDLRKDEKPSTESAPPTESLSVPTTSPAKLTVGGAIGKRSSLAAERVPSRPVVPASTGTTKRAGALDFLRADPSSTTVQMQTKKSVKGSDVPSNPGVELRKPLTAKDGERTTRSDRALSKIASMPVTPSVGIPAPSAAPSTASQRPSSGTIMFNGKEIKGKAHNDLAKTDKVRRAGGPSKKEERREEDEDGWDVL